MTVEKAKALIIKDVIKEPRTFEITSAQMELMGYKQSFELDLQDMEGIGNMYALLTYQNSPYKAIAHALNTGAEVKDVWVLRDINLHAPFNSLPTTPEGEYANKVLHDFYATCQPYTVFGNYTGDSYMDMHRHSTVNAVFSDRRDAIYFRKIIRNFQKYPTIAERAKRINCLMAGRVEQDLNERSLWEHLMNTSE